MIAAYMKEVQNCVPIPEMADKQTNTECAFLPERAKNRLRDPSKEIQYDDRLVKRSQTFSPR